jgi:hypothetical protein
MVGTSSALSYPLAIVIACVLAGATFLGYNHDLDAGVVASIYTAIVSGALVGHFSTTGTGSNNG